MGRHSSALHKFTTNTATTKLAPAPNFMSEHLLTKTLTASSAQPTSIMYSGKSLATLARHMHNPTREALPTNKTLLAPTFLH